MFKIGDKVKVLGNRYGGHNLGSIGFIVDFCTRDNVQCYCIKVDRVKETYYNWEGELELITSTEDKKNNMNLKEKFVQVFLKEPEKSFRKAEVTNGDGVLTSDGQAVFLTWLLQKNGNEFKAEVVDAILEEEKDNK